MNIIYDFILICLFCAVSCNSQKSEPMPALKDDMKITGTILHVTGEEDCYYFTDDQLHQLGITDIQVELTPEDADTVQRAIAMYNIMAGAYQKDKSIATPREMKRLYRNAIMTKARIEARQQKIRVEDRLKYSKTFPNIFSIIFINVSSSGWR